MKQNSMCQQFFVVAALSIVVILLSAPCLAQEPHLVMDIDIEYDSEIRYLTEVSPFVFFAASDQANNQELWFSDGFGAYNLTNPGGSPSHPFSLANIDGTLFFSATDWAVYGREPWVGGTAVSATHPLKDINQGPGDSWPVLIHGCRRIGFFFC